MSGKAVIGELEEFRRKLGVPAVIGAVTTSDDVVAIDVTGDRSRTDPSPATIADQWHIGSCGKSITAMLYAVLVERGLTDWNRPVAELFPDIAEVSPGWAGVTIDDLLHCRAGVPANPTAKTMRAAHKSTEPLIAQRTEAVERVLSAAPHKPGTFTYSNLGYAMVGAAIDRIIDGAFENALFEYVLDPLGVMTAGFGPPPEIRGHHPRVRLGPLLAGKGDPADPKGRKPADNPPLLTPAGRLHVSVPDWAKIQRVFLNDGAPLLTASSVQRLLRDPQPNSKGRSMSMGWASGERLGTSHAMQGSNTMWAATALMDREHSRTALVVANDGRMSVLAGSAHLAAKLLEVASR